MADDDRAQDHDEQDGSDGEGQQDSDQGDQKNDKSSNDGDGKNGDGKSGDEKKNEGEEKRDKERKKAKPIVKIGLILFVILLVVGGFFYWYLTRNEESTDDAYTAGRTVNIAPHVAGYVIELAVNDNQFVREGQVLLRIDPRNYQASVDQAQASVDQAKGQLEGAKYQVEVSKKNFPGQLKVAQGQLAMAQAQQFRAETDYKRQHSISRAATTQQDIDYSTAALDQAKAQVLQSQGQLEQATPVAANIGNSQTRVTQQSGTLEQAEAQLATAKLNLEWTVIRAPHDGWIAQRNVERGNYVQSGQSLFSIVEPEVWISANFKETQIARMRPGQPATVSVDAYPQLKLHAHVDSIQLGSGAAFSAFPPENATGNFVKIVQRVPVKLVIDDGLDPSLPLPIGISVEPTVNVEERKPASAAPR
ncbi:HlyD family efflux transporter periplasmic adaptor subunit [Rhizosaccharibacter radicis]|uniref:Efflux RND transporter periplasmic adaptor subunit n=1 Tax=Rhizosaccharibacter radicis TaxID=2782605 RepID=A0ABT1VXE8_9PROT|nr:efflux RND transporter periplasmic adaptor subunit [Acetobacteraceae bacterium KSS12]